MSKKNVCLILIMLAAVGAFGQSGQTNSIEVDAEGNVRIDTPNLIVNGVEYSVLPPGAIIMWSGAQVPNGWVLCDGSTYTDTDDMTVNTPDLSGRFIVGYQPEDGDDEHDYHTVGAVGGEKAHTLSVGEMPSHTHTTSSDGAHSHTFTGYWANFNHEGAATESCLEDDGDGTFTVWTHGSGAHTHTISSSGGNTAHENRPPYYVLAYIMKIKGKGPNTALQH